MNQARSIVGASGRAALFCLALLLMSLSVDSVRAESSSYTYDALGRVITQTDWDGTLTAYSYDAAGNRTQRLVTLGAAHRPVANPDTLTVSGSTPTTFDPRVNDSDPDNYTLIIGGVTNAPHGAVTFTGTSVTYTAVSGYSGADSFAYTIGDGRGGTASALVTVTVNAPPAAPIAGAVSATVAYNSTNDPITLSLSGGAAASVAVSTVAAHGTATASGTAISYTPTSGYSGADSFQYTATNSIGTSSPATVSVTVNPTAPIAGAISKTVAFNSSGNVVTLSISGGVATGVAVSTNASHGTASASGTSITYTPAANYFGPDSFQYTASNTGGTSSPATATITVNPAPPIAGAVSQTIGYNTSGTAITLSLAGGTATSVSVSTPAGHGTTTASGTSITYTPTSGYSGPDTFQYTASNAGGTSSPATATITVNPAPPIAGPVSASVSINSSSDPIALNLSGGAATSVSVSTAASHGAASSSGTSIFYTPTGGYSGADSFQYTATNVTGTSSAATVSVTIGGGPTAINQSYSVKDSVVSKTWDPRVGDSSPSGYALTIFALGTPSLGSVVINSGGTSITYSPYGTDGTDTFTYTISDGHGGTATATITVTVFSGGGGGCQYC
jgi:YD repeat-containing protein